MAMGDKGDAVPGQDVEHGEDLAEGAAEPGEIVDDEPVAGFEGAHQVIEAAALGRRACRGGGFDELVDLEAVPAGILEDGEALALHVLAGWELGDRRRFSWQQGFVLTRLPVLGVVDPEMSRPGLIRVLGRCPQRSSLEIKPGAWSFPAP